MKRIVLFLVTNLAVMLVLGIMANVLGLNRFLSANGLDLGALLGFAALMGFGGAIISLLISKPMAKWSTGAQVINDSPDPTHRRIVGTVEGFAKKAGIGMPEVAIYEAPEVNARDSRAIRRLFMCPPGLALLAFVNPDLWIRREVGLQLSHDIVAEQRALQVAFCRGS